jgi:hypothetical protein
MHSFSQIEVKESRNASSLLPIKLALIFDLDLFAMVLGYVCADVTLASRDGWEDGSELNFGKGTDVSSVGITPGKL